MTAAAPEPAPEEDEPSAAAQARAGDLGEVRFTWAPGSGEDGVEVSGPVPPELVPDGLVVTGGPDRPAKGARRVNSARRGRGGVLRDHRDHPPTQRGLRRDGAARSLVRCVSEGICGYRHARLGWLGTELAGLRRGSLCGGGL